MKLNNNQQAFLELVRTGLWEKDACLLLYGDIDFQEIYRLAQEQSVVGMLAAGLEHVVDLKVPQEIALQFAGDVLQLEHHNISMNSFINVLFDKMCTADIYALLVKGQGIAQCYTRPTWRACGDVDLLLDNDNYEKAKRFLEDIADSHGDELSGEKHIDYTVDSWVVELHGNMPSRLFKRIDNVLEEIQNDTFSNKNVRIWKNGNTNLAIPAPDNDVIFVFTHILKHFFRGGIGIRQVCDWCRLLWTYKDSLNQELLGTRIQKMGLMSEWKAFAALAVCYLGMPIDAMPYFSDNIKWKRKTNRIAKLIFETGNFGHNRDMSYYEKYPYVIKKTISFWRHTWDSIRQFFIFPLDSIWVWGCMIEEGVLELRNKRKL